MNSLRRISFQSNEIAHNVCSQHTNTHTPIHTHTHTEALLRRQRRRRWQMNEQTITTTDISISKVLHFPYWQCTFFSLSLHFPDYFSISADEIKKKKPSSTFYPILSFQRCTRFKRGENISSSKYFLILSRISTLIRAETKNNPDWS